MASDSRQSPLTTDDPSPPLHIRQQAADSYPLEEMVLDEFRSRDSGFVAMVASRAGIDVATYQADLAEQLVHAGVFIGEGDDKTVYQETEDGARVLAQWSQYEQEWV